MNKMRKIRLLSIIIISMIFVLFGTSYCMGARAANGEPEKEYAMNSFDGRQVGEKWYFNVPMSYATGVSTAPSNNIFCVEKGDRWHRTENWMTLSLKIEISNDIATLYQYNNGWYDSYTKIKTYEGQIDPDYGVNDNALLASIAYNGKGYYDSVGQSAMWKYIPTWVANSGAPMSVRGVSSLTIDQKFIDLAKENKYNVTLYYLTGNKSSQQNLILVERRR